MAHKKQIKQLKRLMQNRMINKVSMFAVALIVVGSVAYFGTNQNQAGQAAALGVLSMTPASETAPAGSNIDVVVSSDSGTDLVDAVQASLTYDATELQFVGTRDGTAFPVVAATSTATPGVIRVGRATAANKTVRGNNTIVTLTFKVLGGSGTTSLAFDPAFSFIVRATDNVNILSASTGAIYTLELPAPAITSVMPAVGPVVGGTSVTINGSNFVNGATVSIGGSSATHVAFVNSTTLTAKTPAHSSGAVNVMVTNPDTQSVVKPGAYSYQAAPLSVSTAVTASPAVQGGASAVLGAKTTAVPSTTVDPSVLIAHDGQNYPPADLNGDGVVGAADMAILQARWHS